MKRGPSWPKVDARSAERNDGACAAGGALVVAVEVNSKTEDDPVENLPRRVLTPVTMRIPEGLEKTIEVFRDFPDRYPFLRFVSSILALY